MIRKLLFLWAMAMVAVAGNAIGRAHVMDGGVDSLHFMVGVPGDGENFSVIDSAYYFQYYRYTYPSVDARGDSVMLSSIAAFPYGDDIRPENVVIGCHVTITHNEQAPSHFLDHASMSTDVRMLIGHTRGNKGAHYYRNMVIIPDFLGYGITADKPHPYLCEELTARNVVDAARHGIDLFLADTYTTASGKTVPRTFAGDDWKTVITGYSQGGAVALATHKFIETNGLADELHLLGSVCGAGPYDPVATLRWYCSTGKVYMPAVVPLMLKGMIDTYPHLQKWTLSDILTEKFLATGIVEMIAEKKHTTTDIDNALLAWSARPDTEFKLYKPDGMPYGGTANESKDVYARIEDCLQPTLLEYFMDDSHFGDNESLQRMPEGRSLAIDLHKALESNDLTVGWKPEHRTLLFHSVGDEIVPYDNARSAMNKLQDDCLVRHIRYTNNNEARMRHSAVGGAFFFSLFGPSVEEQAIEMLYQPLNAWLTFGSDPW